jgi:antibiotic biosynthesis monooxygenase (ABM) superfamily enzyme
MLTTDQVQEEIFYSSAFMEHIVPKAKQLAFRQWHQTLVHSIEQSEGYIRVDRHSPLECKNGVLKCCSVIHFDSPTHLNNWLTSSDRQEIMKSGQQFFETYRFKSFTTGLEGWFSPQAGAEMTSLGPSAWKQALIVVLGLYPVVFLQSKLFEYLGIMQSWSFANAMLVNLFITTIILTWFVMPQITRPLEFWLQPAYALSKTKTELMGISAIVLAMAAMVFLFNY